MARRIKEDPTVHQNRIAQKAEELFSGKGIDNTSMDEQKNSKEAFFSLCYGLVDYQNQYPDFFD